MAATLFATGTAGGGQTAQVTSLGFTVPASVAAGDRLRVYVNSSDSALTLSAFTGTAAGSSVIDGPRANGTSQSTAIIEKTLAGTEAGTTFTVAWSSGSARVVLEYEIIRGAGSGAAVVFVSQDAAATGSFVLPTATSVTAGSFQSAITLRRRSGVSPAGTNIVGSYTAYASSGSNDVATNYASAVNVFDTGGYIASSASGSVGGETWTSTGVTSLGTSYVVITPTTETHSGTLTTSGSGSLSFAGVPAPAGSMAVSSSGSLSFAGTPRPIAALAVTGVGTLTVAGGPGGSFSVTGVGVLTFTRGPITVSGSLAVTGSGSLVFAVSSVRTSGLLAVAGTGALSFAGSPRVNVALSVTGVGTLVLAATPRAIGALARSGVGTLSLTGRAVYRHQVYKLGVWREIVPVVIVGGVAHAVPVKLVAGLRDA